MCNPSWHKDSTSNAQTVSFGLSFLKKYVLIWNVFMLQKLWDMKTSSDSHRDVKYDLPSFTPLFSFLSFFICLFICA